jgi:hypothetical protein
MNGAGPLSKTTRRAVKLVHALAAGQFFGVDPIY